MTFIPRLGRVAFLSHASGVLSQALAGGEARYIGRPDVTHHGCATRSLLNQEGRARQSRAVR